MGFTSSMICSQFTSSHGMSACAVSLLDDPPPPHPASTIATTIATHVLIAHLLFPASYRQQKKKSRREHRRILPPRVHRQAARAVRADGTHVAGPDGALPAAGGEDAALDARLLAVEPATSPPRKSGGDCDGHLDSILGKFKSPIAG